MNLDRKKHEHEREHEHEHEQGAAHENLHAELSEHVSVNEHVKSKGAGAHDQVNDKVANVHMHESREATWQYGNRMMYPLKTC